MVVVIKKETDRFNSTAEIRLTVKEKTNKSGWIKPEECKEYNGFSAHMPHDYKSCCFVGLYKDLTGFEALQHIVKPGDQVTFMASVNNNGYLDKASIPADAWEGDSARYHGSYPKLYHEVLTAKIKRPIKGTSDNFRIIVQHLHISDQVSVDNSARALKV